MNTRRKTALVSLFLTLWMTAPTLAVSARIGDIAKPKGLETITLHGMGIVTGLNGTGDKDALPTLRALAAMLRSMGNPLAVDAQNQEMLKELKSSQNVALVFVTATVPAVGAGKGTLLDCSISALSAKSLSGGQLMSSPLIGPRKGANPEVFALASGRIFLDKGGEPTQGKIHDGCKLTTEFSSQYVKDGKITLVLNKAHADFSTAQEIADQINSSSFQEPGASISEYVARAKDPVNVEVRIPAQYVTDPVLFMQQILDMSIIRQESAARVVINETTSSIVIGAEVKIGQIAISHPGVHIDTIVAPAEFVPLSVDIEKNDSPTLKSLVQALNAVRIPPADIVQIIKQIDDSGKLFGELIIK